MAKEYVVYLHPRYYSASYNKEISTFVTIWRNLENKDYDKINTIDTIT